jgi:hypothetical protein
VRDRLAAEEELDALDYKRREADAQAELNLERISKFEQEEIDAGEEEDEEDAEGEEGVENIDKALNLEAFECPLREWIADERTRREIHRRFKKFLLTYYPGMEEVAKWMKRNQHANPPVQCPIRISPPVYPGKIR